LSTVFSILAELSNAQVRDRSQTLTAQDKTAKIIKTNIALWIAQTVLALLFLMAGFQKAFQPRDLVAQSINWVTEVLPALVRFIGVSESHGAPGDASDVQTAAA
jgi:hypothetical protein